MFAKTLRLELRKQRALFLQALFLIVASFGIILAIVIFQQSIHGRQAIDDTSSIVIGACSLLLPSIFGGVTGARVLRTAEREADDQLPISLRTRIYASYLSGVLFQTALFSLLLFPAILLRNMSMSFVFVVLHLHFVSFVFGLWRAHAVRLILFLIAWAFALAVLSTLSTFVFFSLTDSQSDYLRYGLAMLTAVNVFTNGMIFLLGVRAVAAFTSNYDR